MSENNRVEIAGAAADVEVSRASAAIFDVAEGSSGWGFGASSHLFKNIESYPGQLMNVPAASSAKYEQKVTRKDAVRGARHVERANGHIRGGLDRKANTVVGGRLRVHSTPNAELLGMIAGWTPEFIKTWKKDWSRKCNVLFEDWAYSKRCVQDAERHYNFGGLTWMAYRMLSGPDGAYCGFMGYDEDRARKYHSRWATFMALIDPDRIGTPPAKSDPAEKTVFEGRHLDEHGAMIGYWAQRGHPADGGMDAVEFDYIPRETEWGRPFGFHWFMKARPGSQHGITPLITAVRPSTMLDQFDDARLGAAILQEMFAFYVKSAADPDVVAKSLAPDSGGISPFDRKLDFYKQTKIRIGQNRAAVIPPGDDLEFLTSDRTAGTSDAFVNQFLRKLAMSLDLPFEQFANDYSQANYSSIRAALLDAWRGVVTQRHLFGQNLPALAFDCVIEEALFKGWLTLPPGAPPFRDFRDAYTACTVIGPGMGWVDPKREAEALEIQRRNKFTSHHRVAAENGDDYLEIFDEIETEEEEAEARGFSLESPVAGLATAAVDDDPDAPENDTGRGNQAGE